MRSYSFALAGARLAYLLTIARLDETVIRLTNYSKRLTIDGDIFYPVAGLEIGDITETNSGDVPSVTFKVSTQPSGLFTKEDINDHLFERAEAVLYITDARDASLDDEEFRGALKGDVQFDPMGNAQFEILNKFALPRDIFVRKYSIEDDVDFGDPRRSKIPTFPTVDATSDDLADVERSTAYTLGERRRFRYDTDDTPEDYHNVYWEVTTAGTTGGSEPITPSDTPGATVTDGTAVWTVRNAYARAFQVDSIIDENHITITVTEPRATGEETWFAPGMIVMRTGTMAGFASDVNAWDGTDQISLVVPFAELLSVGDWGEIAPDYDQTLDMAVDKYGSAIGLLADGGANNYRGFPHLTGARIATSTFVPGTTVDNPDGDDPGAGGGGGGGGYESFAVEFESGSD